jgi:hypothetical protein
MRQAPRIAVPEVENDEVISAALAELTGSDHLRCKVAVDPESGLDIHSPGYRVHKNGFAGPDNKPAPMFTFLNEKGQENQVPGHRVAAHLGIEPPASDEPPVEPRKGRRRPADEPTE